MMRPLLLLFSLSLSAQALTPEEAEGRLKMALQIARERNDPALVKAVQTVAAGFPSTLPAEAENSLREIEARVGLDPGGWSMAGQPIFRPTSALMESAAALSQDLQKAMLSQDPKQVHEVTGQMLSLLGDQAGLPDGRRPGVRPRGTHLDEAQATQLFLKALKSEGRAIHSIQRGEALPDQMLRLYGDLLAALATIRPQVAKHAPESLADLHQLAQGCAEILLQRQQPEGHFPFPDLRGKNIRFGAMTERALAGGDLQIREGWILSVDPSGGTQFDTGVCGTALLRAGQVFEQDTWIAAGLRAADWAVAQPCCANFNYNAFSIRLLAQAFRTSTKPDYRQAAWLKFRVGVAPGQAPNGRWLDAHNARTVYHVILLRALGDLAEISPEDRAEVDAVTRPALRALLTEFEVMGLTVEALPELLTLAKLYPDEPGLKPAVAGMTSYLIEKCTDGRRTKMGVAPHQLAAVSLVSP